jgi:hypothetical protein
MALICKRQLPRTFYGMNFQPPSNKTELWDIQEMTNLAIRNAKTIRLMRMILRMDRNDFF